VRGGRVQQDGSDPLADIGAARLAGYHDVDPGGIGAAAELLRLARLAGPLGAFDRDEPALRAAVACHAAECSGDA
jgi:hypothetical protein